MTTPGDEPLTAAADPAVKHLCRAVPIAAPRATAAEIRRALVGQRYECATDVAVCDDGRLVGLISMDVLLAAPDAARAGEIMDADPPVVGPGADQEVAAWKAARHGESSLAVVDGSGGLLGLIPARRLLTVLLEEHHQDMARLAGFMNGSLSATTALQEPLARRFVHRLPWLLLGLAGVLVAADLVALFERRLAAHVMLAFFLPGIVYLADAVGTQTETLIVRGLSVGVPIGRIVWREASTGLLIGGGLAAAAAPLAFVRWGQGEVAVVLGLSVLAACSVATVVGVALPWLLHRAGTDPAFGSGPLATVVQDLLSIVIYLGIAALVLG
jgi:magnesium transporter